MAGLNEDSMLLESYWKYHTQNNISILNMIESFMLHGSDHWFIKPSEWNKLSPEKENIILSDIITTEKSFLDQSELSIFDDIRKLLLHQLKEQQKFLYQKNIKVLILHEENKLLLSNYKRTRSVKDAILAKLENKMTISSK